MGLLTAFVGGFTKGAMFTAFASTYMLIIPTAVAANIAQRVLTLIMHDAFGADIDVSLYREGTEDLLNSIWWDIKYAFLWRRMLSEPLAERTGQKSYTMVGSKFIKFWFKTNPPWESEGPIYSPSEPLI